MKKINQEIKFFRFKSPGFIISTIVSVILFILMVIWSVFKVNTLDENRFFGGAKVITTSTKGSVKFIEKTNDKPMQIWKEDANGNKINDFKILTLSDIHLRPDRGEFCFDVLDWYLKKEQPDLVVLDGDNIYQTTDTSLTKDLGNFFENRNQYWTFVLGNHDSQGWEFKHIEYWNSRKNAFNALSTGQVEDGGTVWDHCLARSINYESPYDEFYGYGLNRIDVLGNNDQVMESLIFTDCQSLSKGKNDKICEWWDDQNFNSDIMLFNHKPFIEMKNVADKVGKDPLAKLNWGYNQEAICYDCDGPTGLFEKMLEYNHHVTMVYGHDHVNNTYYSYGNVSMIYTLGLQYNSYNCRTSGNSGGIAKNIASFMDNSINQYMDGVTEFIIDNTQDNLIIGNKYNQLSGIYDDIKLKNFFVATSSNKWSTLTCRVIMPILASLCITYYVLFTWNKISLAKSKQKDRKEKIEQSSN